MINCSKCNNIMNDDDLFCSKCGFNCKSETICSNELDNIDAHNNDIIFNYDDNTSSHINDTASSIDNKCIKLEIPKSLYIVAGILGCPLATGIAIRSYFKAKKMINNGDYEGASRVIRNSKILLIPILVLSLIALILLLISAGSLFFLALLSIA